MLAALPDVIPVHLSPLSLFVLPLLLVFVVANLDLWLSNPSGEQKATADHVAGPLESKTGTILCRIVEPGMECGVSQVAYQQHKWPQ